MTEQKWNQTKKKPELPPKINSFVSNLQELQKYLEKKILEDQASIDRLEMELEKVKAQNQAQKEKEDG